MYNLLFYREIYSVSGSTAAILELIKTEILFQFMRTRLYGVWFTFTFMCLYFVLSFNCVTSGIVFFYFNLKLPFLLILVLFNWIT